MADWRELVRQRLAGLALDSSDEEDVQAELAAHLEESCEQLRAEGLPEQEAVQRTLAQVADWHDLGRKIALAKKGEVVMKKRIQQLWVPGLVALLLSVLFLMALQKLGFQPRIVWTGPAAILLYVPWLLALPFIGALGAYLSTRGGGSRGTVLLASVFPPLALNAAFLLMFPIDLVVKGIMRYQVDYSFVAGGLLRDEIGWTLIPGMALLAGGLLAQFLFGLRPSSRITVAS